MKRTTKFNDYDGFVDKFKPRKTTDDCYTPQPVYDAVLDYVMKRWGLDGCKVVRPFWPGADYTAAEYGPDAVVIDNPPFSVLTTIIRWYCARSIRFFLFAPSLTLFAARDMDLTYIVANANITYENGAVVRTGFITNLPSDLRIDCNVELMEAITAAQQEPRKQLRGFVYPDNIVTAATLQKLVQHHTTFQVRKVDCVPVSRIDNEIKGRGLYGGGFLLSSRAAAERAAAERAAAERAAAERITLSVRERRIISELDKHGV